MYVMVATKEELLLHLRKNNVRKVRELEVHNVFKIWDYIKEFGKWSVAQAKAFCGYNEYSKDYLRNLIITYDLFSRRKYDSFRKKNEDLCPSYKTTKKILGIKDWKRFIRETMIHSPKIMLDVLFMKTDKNKGVIREHFFGFGIVPPRKSYRRFFSDSDLGVMAKRHWEQQNEHEAVEAVGKSG